MTLLTRAFSSTAVLFCLLVIATTADTNTASLTGLKCKVTDNVHIGDCLCFTKPINHNKTLATLTGHLIRQVNDIEVRVRLFKKLKTFKPFLIDIRENFCNVMAKKSIGYTRLNFLYDVIKKYTNMNHTCPYNGLIEFKSVELDSRKVRDALPPGEYRAMSTAYFNKNKSPSLEVQANFKIDEKFLMG